MPLRIAFDMDGVLADFEFAFREMEVQLFGDEVPPAPAQPEARAEEQHSSSERLTDDPSVDPNVDPLELAERAAAEAVLPRPPSRRKLDAVWAQIENTENFWYTLKPTDPRAVARIRDLTLRYGWEVFFITQRPQTAGESVQRQTQRWLVEQGFDWPSVLVIPGARGKAAGALHLDYVVDDSPKNCVDVIADSKARALLIVGDQDPRTEASARGLGIGTATSIGHCLDILEQAAENHSQPSMLDKLARLVGWKI